MGGMIALKPAGQHVLAPRVRSGTREDFVAVLEQAARGYQAEPSSRQLDACYAYMSAGHFGAYRAADDLDIRAQLPFFFEPVFTAAFSMSQRHRGGFRLMRTMMERLDPAAAAIKTTRGGPALPMRPSTLHRYLPYYRMLGRKGLSMATDQLMDALCGPSRLTTAGRNEHLTRPLSRVCEREAPWIGTSCGCGRCSATKVSSGCAGTRRRRRCSGGCSP